MRGKALSVVAALARIWKTSPNVTLRKMTGPGIFLEFGTCESHAVRPLPGISRRPD